jgi:ketosteroid isomerase-like protein
MHSTPSDVHTPRQADDLAALRQLNHGFIRGVATADAAWFERHLSDDFLNSNPDGTLSDRTAFVRQVARPPSISGLDVADVRIRLFGDAAIIHGRTTYTRADGQPGAGRYTDVWARVGGQWLCAAADVTRC